MEKLGAFGALSEAQRRHLLSRCHHLSVDSGQIILRQGEAGHYCYLIESGRVEISEERQGQSRALTVLGPGSLFGETSLLTGAPRNATARALEPVELLSLSRTDFLQILLKDRVTRSRIFSLLSLRDYPRQAEGMMSESHREEDGSTVVILRDRPGERYFRLSPEDAFLWEQLDGRHNLKDLTLAHLERFGAFAPHRIAETLSALVTAGCAVGRVSQARRQWEDRIATRWHRMAVFLHSLLTFRWILLDTDPFLSRWYDRVVRVLFTRTGLFLLAAFATGGFIVFCIRTASGIPSMTLPWHQGLLLAAGLCLSLVMHEAGHAFTVKFFHRKVHRIGFGWHWLWPVFFVDTTEMWLANRRKRILVNLAGPYANWVYGAMVSYGLLVTEQHSTWHTLCWMTGAASYGIALLNLVPAPGFDGRHVIEECLAPKRSANPSG